MKLSIMIFMCAITFNHLLDYGHLLEKIELSYEVDIYQLEHSQTLHDRIPASTYMYSKS